MDLQLAPGQCHPSIHAYLRYSHTQWGLGLHPSNNLVNTHWFESLLVKVLLANLPGRSHLSPAVLTLKEGPVITETEALPAPTHTSSC